MRNQIKELTLLLIYLTAKEERALYGDDIYLKAKGNYERGILNELQEKEYIWRDKKKNKIYLKLNGIFQAEKLFEKFNLLERNKVVDKYIPEIIPEENFYDSSDKISPLDYLVDLTNEACAIYRPMVEDILNYEIVHDEHIKRLLEALLNCFPTKESEALFNQLCHYYEKYNKNLVNDYRTFYTEKYGDV